MVIEVKVRWGAKALKQLGVQNNHNTTAWMLLGSRAGEKADSQQTLLGIGVPEVDVRKI